ncbi:hypothetical protein ACFLY2_00605 [Patescibacteria group bacterium]
MTSVADIFKLIFVKFEYILQLFINISTGVGAVESLTIETLLVTHVFEMILVSIILV